jgi:hypothetical protein
MKTNRSLKELRLQTRFQDEAPCSIKVHAPPSPSQTLTLDSITKALNKHYPPDLLKPTYIKNHKYTKSHSRLDIHSSIKFQPNSPKFQYTELKSDRKPSKYGH